MIIPCLLNGVRKLEGGWESGDNVAGHVTLVVEFVLAQGMPEINVL